MCCCGSIDNEGGIVVCLNLLSFVAGVGMTGVGGLLVYDAIEKGVRMSVDRWIITIYSILMGILVVASSGVHVYVREGEEGGGGGGKGRVVRDRPGLTPGSPKQRATHLLQYELGHWQRR